jgi:hypothetical protein
MSKLTGNQEFNGDVHIKGIAGYDGTNPTSANSITVATDAEPFTEDEWNEIFGKRDLNVIYTENFNTEDGYTPDSWAEENGYADWAELKSDLENDIDSVLCDLGSQKFLPTDETLEYDGETYDIWNMYCNDGWSETGYKGLVLHGTKASDIMPNAIMTDVSKRYQPFAAILDPDSEIYATPDFGLKYCLLYAE